MLDLLPSPSSHMPEPDGDPYRPDPRQDVLNGTTFALRGLDLNHFSTCQVLSLSCGFFLLLFSGKQLLMRGVSEQC